jgi:hypothetical protein
MTIKNEKEKYSEYKSIMITKDILDRRQLSHLSLEINRLNDQILELTEHNDYLTEHNELLRQQRIEDFEIIQQKLSKRMMAEKSLSFHDTIEHLSTFTLTDIIDNNYNEDEFRSIENDLRAALKRVTKSKSEMEKKKSNNNNNTNNDNNCCICLENKKNILLMPCKHLCLCKDCVKHIDDCCPVCRSHVTNSITVYS